MAFLIPTSALGDSIRATLVSVFLPVCVIGGPHIAAAEASADNADKPSCFCLRSHPLPHCKSFAVTNLAIGYQLADPVTSVNETDRFVVSFDLGYMRNVSTKDAVGASLVFIGSEASDRLGARARYRRWLSQKVGLDGTFGATFTAGGTDGDLIDTPGLLASVGVQAWGWIGMELEMEQVRYSSTSVPYNIYNGTYTSHATDTQWRIKGQAGGGPGIASAAALVALGILVAATWSD